jgi:ABC-type Fe3+/spermidine/putrescine transport system ATPase subunit
MESIALNALSYAYDEHMLLKHFSLTVQKGERLVLLGPSGCGKTTILRLIAGFIAPQQGSIALEGKIVSQNGTILATPEQRNLGMVFQDLALWPHFSVKGNIEFGLKAQGISRQVREEKIRKILGLTGLQGYEKRMPSELSGGQQQRVALARALVLEPHILLMDEPLSSLDWELNRRLRQEILTLQKKLSFTMLYVTHNREEAFEIATRIVILERGEIQMDGSPKEAERFFGSYVR